jgi:LAO/AO transport system kinase
MGAVARRTLSELGAALKREHSDGHWQVPVLSASATNGTGIEALADALEQHHDMLLSRNALGPRRRRYQAQWILKRLQDEFGSFGIARLGGEQEIFSQLEAQNLALFEQYEQFRQRAVGFYSDTHH